MCIYLKTYKFAHIFQKFVFEVFKTTVTEESILRKKLLCNLFFPMVPLKICNLAEFLFEDFWVKICRRNFC